MDESLRTQTSTSAPDGLTVVGRAALALAWTLTVAALLAPTDTFAMSVGPDPSTPFRYAYEGPLSAFLARVLLDASFWFALLALAVAAIGAALRMMRRVKPSRDVLREFAVHAGHSVLVLAINAFAYTRSS